MIKKDTIVRTIVLILVLLNQVLVSTGVMDFMIEESQIYEFVSIVATLIMSVVAWWKNNSITPEAIKADEYLKELKGK